MRDVLRLATRGSPLALLQAERVGAILSELGGVSVELVIVETRGDIESAVPISQMSGQGVFVKEVQQAILDDVADAAVHSAKDLPSVTVDGLVLACVPERADPRDVMVGQSLDGLPTGATVATGSPRRRAQLASLRPDLSFCDLRGNIAKRIERSFAVGAGVMAMAALDRLGLSEHAACVLEPSEMLPQVGQGALGLECRVDDREVLALLEAADDKVAHRNVDAERSWLAYLGGGCSAPVGAFAVESSDHPGLISLEGMIASQDGRIVLRRTAVGSDPDELGRRLGDEMLRNGGSLLDEFAGPGAQR